MPMYVDELCLSIINLLSSKPYLLSKTNMFGLWIDHTPSTGPAYIAEWVRPSRIPCGYLCHEWLGNGRSDPMACTKLQRAAPDGSLLQTKHNVTVTQSLLTTIHLLMSCDLPWNHDELKNLNSMIQHDNYGVWLEGYHHCSMHRNMRLWV